MPPGGSIGTQYYAAPVENIDARRYPSGFDAPSFDAAVEIERRITFIAGYLAASGMESLVLGISGGVDSTTAGRLCQLAAERLQRRIGRRILQAPLRTAARSLPVAAEQNSGYDRDRYFGDWKDADRDCRNTRAEVLQKESRVTARFSSTGCTVKPRR